MDDKNDTYELGAPVRASAEATGRSTRASTSSAAWPPPSTPVLDIVSQVASPLHQHTPTRRRAYHNGSNGSPLRARGPSSPSHRDLGEYSLDAVDELGLSSSAGKRREGSPRPRQQQTQTENDASSLYPPSFAESQFATIVRRQRKRRIISPTAEHVESAAHTLGMFQPQDGEAAHEEEEQPASKGAHLRRMPSGPDDEDDDSPIRHAWEFAGWGRLGMLVLTPDDLEKAKKALDARPKPILGQWRAFALAGNAVTGSIFYSLPAVFSAANVWSPLSLFVASILLWPFRPVICELASALSSADAGNWTYLMNSNASRFLALTAAAITLLDAVATAAVSAATAASYLSAEVSGAAISYEAITAILLIGLATVCLSGMRDSSNVALAMVSFHLITMFILLMAAVVAWGKAGSGLLVDNWHSALGGKSVARAIFDGVCIAFVGFTGTETVPGYVGAVKKGTFPKALRNLHISIILMEPPMALLLIAVVPMSQILGAPNVLALLASVASGGTGAWLKLLVIVDAVIVLSGGILTGTVAAGGLIQALVSDRIIARWFESTLPRTGAKWAAVGLFLVLATLMCVITRFNLPLMSSIFSLTFLFVMTLFPVSLLLILHSRPSLPRDSRTPVLVIMLALVIGIIASAGNIALSPTALFATAIGVSAILLAGLILANKVRIVRLALWAVEQRWLPGPVSSSLRWTLGAKHVGGLRKAVIRWIRRSRREPVIYLCKTDEISMLVRVLSYISRMEGACSHVIIVHCFEQLATIPTELEANVQLVDESFPHITVDLVFVEATFSPLVVEALSARLGVPRTRMFISCPSKQSIIVRQYGGLAEYGSLRVITD